MYKPENPAPTITASRAVIGSVAVIVPPNHGATATQLQQGVPRVPLGERYTASRTTNPSTNNRCLTMTRDISLQCLARSQCVSEGRLQPLVHATTGASGSLPLEPVNRVKLEGHSRFR